jgi:asparagine synthase (glutamine-hydrolysing)
LLIVRDPSDPPEVETYWSATEIAEGQASTPLAGTECELLDQLETLLETTIRQQMVADVPIGAFLSGGIDSSMVVTLMQKLSSRSVKTFTIGFGEAAYNEANDAAAVARHLGTDHTELYVTPEDARAVIPQLPSIYDEPFADSSQIPMCLVSKLACKEVKVALSGDGGDELFGGYNRHLVTAQVWDKMSKFPAPLRKLAGAAFSAIPNGAWSSMSAAAQGLIPRWAQFDRPAETIRKGLPLLGSRSAVDLYRGIVSLWTDPASVVIDGTEPECDPVSKIMNFSILRPTERMMAVDMVTYLPDDILVKVDRAAMAVSLETRVPYLDHRIVGFAWQLPFDLKIREGRSKWALRELLSRYVPEVLVDRPKKGFAVPIGTWLRGPLRDWADALLDPLALRQQGYFNAVTVRNTWQRHLNGSADEKSRLWVVLMFQAWLQANASKLA